MEYGFFSDKDPKAFPQWPFRCPSWDPMPDGKKNVVILGCSHTWGVGLEEHETWAYKVSQHNTDRLRYFNLGQPGYSPEGVVRMLYRTEKSIFPKIIIICWPQLSRREWYGGKKIPLPLNLMGYDEKLRFQTAETDMHVFLRSVFFAEKFAEHNDAKILHCFADTFIDLKKYDPNLGVLENYTLKNCWPYWDKFTARDIHATPSKARDGLHYGVEHHSRFAELFLQKFSPKLK